MFFSSRSRAHQVQGDVFLEHALCSSLLFANGHVQQHQARLDAGVACMAVQADGFFFVVVNCVVAHRHKRLVAQLAALPSRLLLLGFGRVARAPAWVPLRIAHALDRGFGGKHGARTRQRVARCTRRSWWMTPRVVQVRCGVDLDALYVLAKNGQGCRALGLGARIYRASATWHGPGHYSVPSPLIFRLYCFQYVSSFNGNAILIIHNATAALAIR